VYQAAVLESMASPARGSFGRVQQGCSCDPDGQAGRYCAGRRKSFGCNRFYQIIETSDAPAGLVNIVTGSSLTLVKLLAEHDDGDSIWAFGSSELSEMAERFSIGNRKRSFVNDEIETDGNNVAVAECPLWLNDKVDTKNIWIRYGE
jgi:hypothetical protein